MQKAKETAAEISLKPHVFFIIAFVLGSFKKKHGDSEKNFIA